MANDNFRMVPASQLPTVGTVSGDGRVRLDRDLAFEQDCRRLGVEPDEWRAAIRATQARWRRSAMFEAMRTASGETARVGKAPHQ